MNTEVISLQNIAVFYGRNRGVWGTRFWALKDVSFNLYKGETLGVIGRNGAGKSSLLRLLAGTIKPDQGEIINAGYSVLLLSLNLGLIPHLSGRENAVLSGMLMGLSKPQIESLMPAIIEFSELNEFIDQPVATYSSGMTARLGFSVAFQTDPDILLVDEVLGVGDEDFRAKSTTAMRAKIATDKTVVLVSHNLSVVRDLCQRAVWIEQGESRLEGATDEVLAAYQEYVRELARKKKP